ncbi:MAG: hypothetical protein JNJ77_08125 [Planctomycetia bacterium]|nr:hypothetical protein [Planctomycetia bacterium]
MVALQFLALHLALLLPASLPWHHQHLADPLKCLPENAIAVLQIPSPTRLINQWQGYFNHLQLNRFEEVSELLQSTPAVRFKQYLNYLETEYKQPWHQLLDGLAAKGLTLALVPQEGSKQPQIMALAVANDSVQLKKISSGILDLIKENLGQENVFLSFQKQQHRGATIHSLGNQFYLAVFENYFMAGNGSTLIKTTIDRIIDGKGKSLLDHPRFIVKEKPSSEDVTLWGWFDAQYYKDQAKSELENIKLPANDIIPQLLLGGLLDTWVRSDHFWLSLSQGTHGPCLEVTSPAGRKLSQEGARILHMHDPERESLLSLLNPPGTVFSTSFYFNFAEMWKHRTKLFKEGALKDVEEGEKTIKPFLAGNTPGKIISTLGARHRLVIAQQRKREYTTKPKIIYPAAALVFECTDPDQFNKMIAVPLHTAGFLYSTQVSMKLNEETFMDTKIISYQFTENEKNQQYEQGVLFNVTPSFARAGNYFVLSSSRELCRNLVKELRSNQTDGHADKDHADIRHRFSWTALGQVLSSEQPRIATELTLRHGGDAETVETQISSLLSLLNELGTIELSISHSPVFRLQLQANYLNPKAR